MIPAAAKNKLLLLKSIHTLVEDLKLLNFSTMLLRKRLATGMLAAETLSALSVSLL